MYFLGFLLLTWVKVGQTLLLLMGNFSGCLSSLPPILSLEGKNAFRAFLK